LRGGSKIYDLHSVTPGDDQLFQCGERSDLEGVGVTITNAAVGEVTGNNQVELQDRGNIGTLPGQSQRLTTYEQLLKQLSKAIETADISQGLRGLSEHVGAAGYLLMRQDANSGAALDSVIASDWPYDLVRKSMPLLADVVRTTELDKCLSVLQPQFAMLPDTARLPKDASNQYCSIAFNVGRVRYNLTLLCPVDVILSQQGLRAIGVHCSYLASLLLSEHVKSGRELELTDRELECLYWIAEGKTSDEIATIIGISKNTINNYITSVMRKTATRTRSEAIAYAVRNNLV
jgi:DNA-binding CsgD family transcriptional regulator